MRVDVTYVRILWFLKMNSLGTATGKLYKVRSDLTCKSDSVIYLISFKKCKQQYVGSAFESNFKPT